MSRGSRRDVHYEFGMLILVCARKGHEVARVWRQPDGRTLVSQSLTHVHANGEKLRLSCQACQSDGYTTDLQMSWSKLDEKLELALADTQTRSRKVTIG